jgi:NADPH2:quinone reductase
MKAVLSKAPGGPSSLVFEDVAPPVPKADEALIAVKACSVNFPDALIIEDKYQFRPPRPFAPGSEVAGVVEAVGADVKDVTPGDCVIGLIGYGGMAEKVVAGPGQRVVIPPSMPFEDAACLLVTYGTSYYSLKQRASLKAGETLLVLGASGGVGSAAVELGKAMGANVVAATSSADRLRLAKECGADSGVVYPAGPFDKDGRKALAELFKGVCGAAGAHVVLDPVGGDYAEAALRAIAWEGRFLVVGFPAGIPSIPLNLPLLKNCQIVGVFYGAFSARDPKTSEENTRELIALYSQGKIRPRISARYPLSEAARAISDLAGRKAVGKIVVTIG